MSDVNIPSCPQAINILLGFHETIQYTIAHETYDSLLAAYSVLEIVTSNIQYLLFVFLDTAGSIFYMNCYVIALTILKITKYLYIASHTSSKSYILA